MHRWWGCEISFGSGLDDVFGVDHNKQMAAEISAAARAMDAETRQELSEGIDSPVYGIVDDIHRMIRNMLGDVRLLFKKRSDLMKPGTEDDDLTPAQEAEERATDATDTPGADTDTDTQQAALTEYFRQDGVGETEARELATRITRRKIRYAFHEKKLPGDYMFSVDNVDGVLVVSLNIEHELHEFLEVLEHHTDDGLEDPWARRAAVGIRTLLLAWARLEDGVDDRAKRRDLQRVTAEWGEHAAAFLPQLADEFEADAEYDV